MFIRSFVEIPGARPGLEADLLGSPAYVLAGPARVAGARGERLLADIGFGQPPVRLTSRVELRFGSPIRLPSKTVVPFAWQPTSLASLIPDLEADLELAEMGPTLSQLSISARYTPPLGSIGSTLDRALLHRVAEAMVKDLVEGAAERLTALRSSDVRASPA
jgi:hypothetical protein